MKNALGSIGTTFVWSYQSFGLREACTVGVPSSFSIHLHHSAIWFGHLVPSFDCI